MTRPVVFLPLAEAQLAAIYDYIAVQATDDIARSYTDAIVARCQALNVFASRGTPRDDLRPGLRTLSFRRRVLIVYAVEPAEVAIVGIFYGGQDVAAAFREE